ncbi:hypothetical protein [Pedobacter sp. L105]|uniref:hypothetical protein n=1 Tax=Pedobacter sp. L105 TaxID=1641871 RepID=UPI00131C7C89|nr:hypothetical protein [Pedobacter sp. L105]
MGSSREKDFLRMLSAFLDCDYNLKQDLTLEDYFILFSIEVGHLDTFTDSQTEVIRQRLWAKIEASILDEKAPDSP